MAIITDAVFASTHWNGLGFFKFDVVPLKVKTSLKAVTKRQRHKYKKHGIIPLPVLEALWFMGLLPGEKLPLHGMRLLELLKHLREGRYRDDRNMENAKWLYHEIVTNELIAFGSKRKIKVPKAGKYQKIPQGKVK